MLRVFEGGAYGRFASSILAAADGALISALDMLLTVSLSQPKPDDFVTVGGGLTLEYAYSMAFF